MVCKLCLSFKRHLEADYVWLSCIEICLYFFWSKVAAVTVITWGHLVFCLDLADAFKTFCITEAVVSFAVFD